MSIISESIAAARVIQALYNPSQFRVPSDIVRETFGAVETAAFTGSLFTCAQVGIFYGNAMGLVVIAAGVSLPQHARTLAEGYANADTMESFAGGNATSWGDAFRVLQRIDTPPGVSNIRLRLFGHSAGGAMVENLARQILQRRNIQADTIVTYGAPKPGFPGLCVESHSTTRRRWMVNGDPVPIVPNAVISPAYGIMLGLFGVRAEPWRCVHGNGGYRLDGRTAIPGNETLTSGGAAARIEEWMNRSPDRIAEHSIGEYLRRLSNLTDEGATTPSTPAPADSPRTIALERVVGLDQAPAPVRRTEMVAPSPMPPAPIGLPTFPVVTVNGSTVTYTNGDTIPAVVNDEGNMSQSKIRPNMRFRVRSVGGSYWVTFQGFTVFTSTKLTKCKTIAKSGNRFLRIMGNDVQVDGPNLVTGIGTFLALAAVPGNGVTPPLNVV